MSTCHRSLTWAWVYFTYFFLVSLEFTYLPSYFLHNLGFSGSEFAAIYGGIPMVSLIAQPFWGQIADSTKKTGRVIRICTSLGLLVSLPVAYCTSFATVAAFLWTIAFCISAVPPLLDTIVITRFGVENYGKIRVGGSIGYGASALFFSLWPVELIVYSVPFCMFLCWLGSLFVGEESRKSSTEGKRRLFALVILGRPAFLVLLLFAIVHWSSSMPYHIILNVHREGLSLPPYITGLAVATAIVCESIVISLSAKWLPMMQTYRWLMVAAAFTAFRWLVMSNASSGPVIVAVQALHAFTYSIFSVASISYVTETVEEDMRATGQTLFAAMAYGIGSIVGSAYTGLFFNLPMSPSEKGFCVFRISTLISLTSLIFALLIGILGTKRRNS